MIEYRRDPVKKRVTLVAHGDVTLQEVLEVTSRQAGDGSSWADRVLYDARLRRGALTVPDLKQLADVTADYIARLGPRGRLAIVVPDEGGYGMAQMYAFVGARFNGEIEVFRNLVDAERWLDEVD